MGVLEVGSRLDLVTNVVERLRVNVLLLAKKGKTKEIDLR